MAFTWVLFYTLVFFHGFMIESKPCKSTKNRPSPKVVETCDGINYLNRFGYTTEEVEDLDTDRQDGKEKLKKALKNFQVVNDLPVTGTLDKTTIEKMNTPRCGDSDENLVVEVDPDTKGRVKRYVVDGAKWLNPQLTYKFLSHTPDMSVVLQEEIIEKAFNAWSSVANINFTKVSSSENADIRIVFGSYSHLGCPYSFDGAGGTLAHAYYPSSLNTGDLPGDAHFDDSEKFTDQSIQRFNLYFVAVHEFGHSIGLAHSGNSNAIMAPYYKHIDLSDPYPELHPDDAAGAIAIYGEAIRNPPATNPPTTDPPTTAPPTTAPPATGPPTIDPPATDPPATDPPATDSPATDPPTTAPPATDPPATDPPTTDPPTTDPPTTDPPTTDPPTTDPPTTNPPVPAQPSCSSPIDAVTAKGYSNMLVFQGLVVIENRFITSKTSQRVSVDYISDIFPDGPSNIDVAFTVGGSKLGTYLCKGESCWRYLESSGVYQLVNGYPKTIQEDFGINLNGETLKAVYVKEGIEFAGESRYWTYNQADDIDTGSFDDNPIWAKYTRLEAAAVFPRHNRKGYIANNGDVYIWRVRSGRVRSNRATKVDSFFLTCA